MADSLWAEPQPYFSGEIHPYADTFPMLPEDDLRALADDIKANGLRHPLLVTPDGVLVDGRNRLAACGIAGVTPRFEVTDQDPVAVILSENMQRRDLTQGQKAHLAVAAEQRSGSEHSVRQLARIAGVGAATIAEARVVAEHAPELAAQVIAGGLPHSTAYQQAKDRRKQQLHIERMSKELRDQAPDLFALIDDGFTLEMAFAAYEERHRKEREAEQEARRAAVQAAKSIDDVVRSLWLVTDIDTLIDNLTDHRDQVGGEHWDHLKHAAQVIDALIERDGQWRKKKN